MGKEPDPYYWEAEFTPILRDKLLAHLQGSRALGCGERKDLENVLMRARRMNLPSKRLNWDAVYERMDSGQCSEADAIWDLARPTKEEKDVA